MKAPIVELKKLKTFNGMEGEGFNAEVWINGVKCMDAIDDGNGGSFHYYNNTYQNPKADLVKANIKLLEDHIKSLPPINFGGMELTMDMDLFMDELINKLQAEKQHKKFLNKKLKLQETAFLFGIPDADEYRFCRLQRPMSTYSHSTLQTYLNQMVLTHCKKGIKILNTNLDKYGLKVI